MKRNVIAVAAALSLLTAFILTAELKQTTTQAQDREAAALESLKRADLAFDEKRFADAGADYLEASEDLPAGDDLDRAITRALVSLSEAGEHQRLDQLAVMTIVQRVQDIDARIDAYRMAGLYFAARDHDYHLHRKENMREYELVISDLPEKEQDDWRYINTARDDVRRAKGLVARAHETSTSLLETTAGSPTRAQRERHVALTLEYCDLLEVNDRLHGQTSNSMHFFGDGYAAVPFEYDDEPTESEATEDRVSLPTQPSQEPFTRRGYYLQPSYSSLPTIKALMQTATHHAGELNDEALKAAILYRRAVLMMNVGLYGNAELNARLTDWRNPQKAEPDITRDPRLLLHKLLKEHTGSIWDDEARFLLGYIAYYLNDFDGARDEFAKLEKDHPKSKYIGEARRLVQVIEFPQLFTSFSTGGSDNALVAPGQSLSISVFARNVDRVKVSLRPLDLSKVLGTAENVEHVYSDLAEIEKLPGFEDALGLSVMDQSFALDPQSQHFYQSRSGLPLYTSTPGVYLLEVSGGPVLERKLVQVADLAVQRRRLAGSEQFWVTTRDGSPLSDVIIRGGYHENLHVEVPYRETVMVDPNDPEKGTKEVVRFREERRLVTHAVNGRTGANGLFEAALPEHTVNNFWATLDIDGDLFLVNDHHEPKKIKDPAPWLPQPVVEPVRDLRAFVYSDRPVYRPGDTAWLRLIARLPMGEGTLQGEPALLQVLYGGVEQFREEVTLNEFGCATAKFEVPHGAPVGDYEIVVSSPRIGGDTRFRMEVLEYFKKDIKLEIEAPTETLAPGSEFDLPIVFRYLAGGMVQGGRVDYRVNARSADGRSWTPVAGQANTNLEGRVLVPIDTKAISESANGRAVTLTVSASGQGPGGQTVHAEATARISGSGITVEADWPSANWLQGNRVQLDLSVTDAAGDSLNVKGTYRVWRITDQSSLEPAKWNNPSIKKSGENAFALDRRQTTLTVYLPGATGRYYIEVEGSANGESFKFTHKLLSVAQGRLDNRPFAILPEYDDYDLTQPTRIFICQPRAGDVLLNLHADGQESEHRIITSAPDTGIHLVELGERHAPHVHICARAVRSGQFEADHCAVRVRPASKLIRTTVRFDKDEYKPGEQAHADIFTVDPLGNPVEAEVALSVWDSALKEFATSELAKTNLYDHFFAGTTEFIADDRTIARQTRVRPTRHSDARVKLWKTYGMPPGSYFYGTQSWTSTRQVSLFDMLESPDELLEDLKIVEDARDSMNADWAESPNESPHPYYGTNSRIGLGGGIGGGGGRGGKGGFTYRRARGGGGRPYQEISTRDNLRDSAYFNPSMRTNEKGVASVTFTLPDNLTEWTFEATSVDRTAGVGQTSGSFKVARELSVRMVGPRGLTEGDEVELTALVQNLGDLPASVSCGVTLNVDEASAPLTLMNSPSPESVSISAGSTQEVRFRVKVETFGTAKLKIEVASDDDMDSLVWTYEVAPRGMPVTTTLPFRFEPGQDLLTLEPQLPKGAMIDRSSLSVQFNGSLLGSVVDALPGLVRYPHGCAEQTTNKFVPLISVMQLLKAYDLDLHEISRVRRDYSGAAAGDIWPSRLADPLEIQRMVDLGFGKLRDYQNADGGWGWFNIDGSNPHLSAIVLDGLCKARETAASVGLSLPASEAVMDDMFADGAEFLLEVAAGESDAALRARALHTAARAIGFLPVFPEDTEDPNAKLREKLDQRLIGFQASLGNDFKEAARRAGGSSGLAALILALHEGGRERDAQFALKALLASAREDGDGVTFPHAGTYRSRWHDNAVEAQAAAIEAISVVAPDEPLLKRAVDTLLQDKRGGGWGNTRATGAAIHALAAYLSSNDEETAEARVGIRLGDAMVGSFERSKDKLISGRTRFDVGGELLKQQDGSALTLSRSGRAQVSGSVTVRAFIPVDDDVMRDDNGLGIWRVYHRRTSTEKEIEVEVRDERNRVLRRYTEMRVEHEYSALHEGDELKVGDIITVTIEVTAREGDRYICIEDARPACLEPISSKYEPRKGWIQGRNGVDLTKEERDTSTNFYAEKVDGDGKIYFRYDCVVVAGGRFTALPARAFDMYDEGRNGHSSSSVLNVK